MSRSYKRTLWCGDHKGKSKKRIANHHVRNWFKRNPDVILPQEPIKKFIALGIFVIMVGYALGKIIGMIVRNGIKKR